MDDDGGWGNWRWTCRGESWRVGGIGDGHAFETVTQLLRTLEQVFKFLRIVNVRKYLNINNLGVAILISSPP